MRRVHHLKCWPAYFHAIKDGRKTFEIRRNDRGFKEGEHLILEEYHPEHGYTGNVLAVNVTYLTDFGQPAGQIVMGIKVTA